METRKYIIQVRGFGRDPGPAIDVSNLLMDALGDENVPYVSQQSTARIAVDLVVSAPPAVDVEALDETMDSLVTRIAIPGDFDDHQTVIRWARFQEESVVGEFEYFVRGPGKIWVRQPKKDATAVVKATTLDKLASALYLAIEMSGGELPPTPEAARQDETLEVLMEMSRLIVDIRDRVMALEKAYASAGG